MFYTQQEARLEWFIQTLVFSSYSLVPLVRLKQYLFSSFLSFVVLLWSMNMFYQLENITPKYKYSEAD